METAYCKQSCTFDFVQCICIFLVLKHIHFKLKFKYTKTHLNKKTLQKCPNKIAFLASSNMQHKSIHSTLVQRLASYTVLAIRESCFVPPTTMCYLLTV